jgi:hypothetical protein
MALFVSEAQIVMPLGDMVIFALSPSLTPLLAAHVCP